MHPSEVTLNEYVENALRSADAGEIEQHLEDCAICRALADDLREIRRMAAELPVLSPPVNGWTRLLRSLEHERQHPAWSRRTVAWWLTTAAALVLATGVVWLVAPHMRSEPPDPQELAEAVVVELRQAEEHYQHAIAGLERIVEAQADALDPETAASLRESLEIIDRAIGESRAALDAQPNNEPARLSLIDNFRQKMLLLQRTVALAGEVGPQQADEPAAVPEARSKGTV